MPPKKIPKKKTLMERVLDGADVTVDDLLASAGRVRPEPADGKYLASYPMQSRWRELWLEFKEAGEEMEKLAKIGVSLMEKHHRAKARFWSVVEEDTRDRRPMRYIEKKDTIVVLAKEEDDEEEEED